MLKCRENQGEWRLKKQERVRKWRERVSEHSGRWEGEIRVLAGAGSPLSLEGSCADTGWSVGLVAVDGSAFFSISAYFLGEVSWKQDGTG